MNKIDGARVESAIICKNGFFSIKEVLFLQNGLIATTMTFLFASMNCFIYKGRSIIYNLKFCRILHFYRLDSASCRVKIQDCKPNADIDTNYEPDNTLFSAVAR